MPWRPDVALVTPYPRAGSRHAGHSGVASYAANLAHALAGSGMGVAVVAPEEPGEAARRLDGPVRVERRFRRGAGALPAAALAARRVGAPVIHLQHEHFLYGGPSSVPGLLPALATIKGGGRAVVTMHQVVDPAWVDREFVRMHRVRSPALAARLALGSVQAAIRNLADRVIVHERGLAGPLPGAAVVPHGVEAAIPAGREEARARLGLDRRLTALCFGFVAPYKGIEIALEAAMLAGERVHLVVAGGEHPRLGGRDSYAASLRARFAPRATFTGRVPEADLPLWFAAADLALFMYPRPFSSSGALALALAHGTPPLLSPALARSVGAPAALVAPAEPIPLARHLRELSARPELLEPVREAAHALAGERSWREVARRHLEIYGEVSDADGAAGRCGRTG